MTFKITFEFKLIFLFMAALLCQPKSSFAQSTPEVDPKAVQEVRQFITENWGKTVKYNPEDKGEQLGLPKPYNVPTVQEEEMFKELYYWDTYFTNLGLLRDNLEQAKNNVENIMFMVERYGKMPNGSLVRYLNRSQPPYLSMMVADIYKQSGDKKWLQKAVQILEEEYAFWMTERMTPVGLNHYSNSASEEKKLNMAEYVKGRLKKPDLLEGLSREEVITLGSHFISEAESGWDFNPRFLNHCENFIPLDLNSNLYLYEKNFAFFYKELGQDQKSGPWKKRAKKRQSLINKYCFDKSRNLFFDYDYVNNKKSPIVSSALFSLLYSEVPTSSQAEGIIASLPLLETKYGLRATMEGPYELVYQWGASNGWAPLHLLAVEGLRNYGYETEAKRIRNKFICLVSTNFKKTGNLWEKYNVLDGSTNTSNEYEMPAFLGWTAGVFMHLTK